MFDILHQDHPEREDTLKFIANIFQKAYGADIQQFMPEMMIVRDKQLQLRSAMGYRDASKEQLYLEYYLDEPIEKCLSNYLGQTVERSQIVEVGNLAEALPGDARMAIIGATAYFHNAGYRWVVFTGVRRLRNVFVRLGLSPKQLIQADESRLPAGDLEKWGTYYNGDPVVCFGALEEGHSNLKELWTSMRNTWTMAEQAGENKAALRRQT